MRNTYRLSASACCVLLNVILTTSSSVRAADPTLVPIDVSDISYLWPVPTSPQEVANLISLDDKRSDGTPLISKTAFDVLIDNALNKGSVKDASGQTSQIKFPAGNDADFKQPKTWKITAFRVDASAPGTSPALALTQGSSPQIRLIVQPVTVNGNTVTVHDTTAHLVFSYVLNAVPPFQPDKAKFKEILTDLVALKQFLKGKSVSTQVQLGVHPGLRTPVQGFLDQVKGFLFKHLDERKLSAMAFMGLNPPAEPWIFLALFRPGNDWVVAPNASFKGSGVQMITFKGGSVVSPEPTTTNLDGKKGVSTAPLFAAGIEQKLDMLVFADTADLKNKDIPDLVANPMRSHFFNTDCISCHSESTRRNILKLGDAASPYKYKLPAGISGLDQSVSPQDQWNVRNFGWGGTQGKATVTLRTANESAEAADFINKNYIPQQLPKADAEEVKPVTFLKQGWTEAERNQFYTTPQGSLLIPYSWFLQLEQASNNEPFRRAANMDRFRYLPGEPDPKTNPDSLPVGFVKETTERLKAEKSDIKLLDAFMGKLGKDETNIPSESAWLGMTCSACHTAQLEVNGKRLRIDGGPTMADFNWFIRSLSQAVEATLFEKPKFNRFTDAILGQNAAAKDRNALRQRMSKYSAALAAYRDRNSPQFAHGYGRIDAFGLIMNEVFGTSLKIPANYRLNDAPVSYPELWLTPQLDWVQWNGSVANPFARNVGEVLGVFGHANASAPLKDSIPSSVLGSNIHQLEQLVSKLAAPVWDEAVLGRLDQERIKRGEKVFKDAGCANCHGNKPPYAMTVPNRFDKQFIKSTMVSLEAIGTDPKMATNFAKRTALPGVLGQESDPPVIAPSLLSTFVTQVTQRQFTDLKLTPEAQREYSGFRGAANPPNLMAYKAKPLAGIWATAPYLHNGSVPSLQELLKAPPQRVRVFYTGSREFDPKAVGFKTDEFEAGFLFDTSLPGNSNAGHTYGTGCTAEDRADLLEYLKSL